MKNPYRVDVDVATDRSFKLWKKATKGLPEDELCNLSQSKIKSFKDTSDEARNKFYWGEIIQAAPIEIDDERNIILGESLLAKTSILATSKVKENAEQIWGNMSEEHAIDNDETHPIVLQQRAISSMASAWLKIILATGAKQKLCLNSELLRNHNQDDGSHEDDRPTMVHLMFDVTDPKTTISVAMLKIMLV